MSVNRRDFLKISTLTAGGLALSSSSAYAAAKEKHGNDLAMLNDSTKCTGCRACQTACKDNKKLEADKPNYPKELDAKNLTVIKMKKDKGKMTFVKRQCMHCLIPTCVSACPVSALIKQKNGIVSYDKDKCIGCRYCMYACPYGVPAFEYDKAFPEIKKCDFCEDRTSKGETTVCASVCPVGAIAFGSRKEMLAEAKRRIKKHPDRYVNHIYGEKELGGTSVFYISPVKFEELGFKTYSEKSPVETSEAIQHGIFKFFIPPVALFGALGIMSAITKRKDDVKNKEDV